MNYEEQKKKLQQSIFNRRDQIVKDSQGQSKVVYSNTQDTSVPSKPDNQRLKRGCGCRRG